MEPDQGNGEISTLIREGRAILMCWRSSLTHHLAVKARRGFESSGTADLHSGA